MPMIAGPYDTSLFHRTVPSKRTAKPSRVVLLQRTLIAVVQAGSDRSCAKRSVAPPGDVNVTGRFKMRGWFSR